MSNQQNDFRNGKCGECGYAYKVTGSTIAACRYSVGMSIPEDGWWGIDMFNSTPACPEFVPREEPKQ